MLNFKVLLGDSYLFKNQLKKLIEIQKQEISEINEVEVEEKKTDYLKIFGIIILIIFILYFLELKNQKFGLFKEIKYYCQNNTNYYASNYWKEKS